MNNFMSKIESYYTKEFTEKAGRLGILFLFLCVPDFQFKVFFIFLLASFFLTADLKNRKYSAMLSLPFSRTELFFSAFIFNLSIIVISQLSGSVLFGLSGKDVYITLLRSAIMFCAYFGISIISVVNGHDNFGFPLIFFIIDLVAGGIFDHARFINPYRYISPIYQGNILISGIFSVVILVFSYYVFSKRGVSR